MQPKELLEEIGDRRFGPLADQLIRSKPVDLISGEAQFAASRHHVGVDPQRRMVVCRDVPCIGRGKQTWRSRAIVDVIPYLPGGDRIDLVRLEERPFSPAGDAFNILCRDRHDGRDEGSDGLSALVVLGTIGKTL